MSKDSLYKNQISDCLVQTNKFKLLYNLEKIKECSKLVKEHPLFNYLINFDLISNFDFILSTTISENIGKLTVDTNTADLNKQNSEKIEQSISEDYKKQTQIITQSSDYISVNNDLLLQDGYNIAIKYIKKNGYFAPHNHDVGEESSIIYGVLINDLKTPSKFCVDEAFFNLENTSLRKKLKTVRETAKPQPTACIDITKNGDDFAFYGDCIHSFECFEYTEMLFIAFNKKPLFNFFNANTINN